MSTAETRTVIIERDLAHAPEKVWRALTRQHLIADWLMDNDFEPIVGHKFKLRGEWGGILDCEVLSIEPERSVSYSWDFANEDPNYALKSVVTYTLTPSDKGTMLRMEQAGFRSDQKQAYGGAHAGWKGFFERLDQVLSNKG